MKKILVSAFVAVLTTMSFAQEDSVKIILDKYFENMGGIDAWKELTGIKMSAEVEQGGMKIPVDIYEMADSRSISIVNFMGMTIYQDAFDGTTAWSTNQMSMKPEKASAEDLENTKRDVGDFPSPFFNYEEKGFTVTYLGEEVIDGVECYKLKLVKKPLLVDDKEVENVSYTYFDQENYVPIRTEAEVLYGQQKGIVAVSEFSDYQEVDGLYFPFSMLVRSADDTGGMLIQFNSIELNPKVEEGFFSFPAE